MRNVKRQTCAPSCAIYKYYLEYFFSTWIYHWKKFWFGNMTASLHRHSKLLCYIRSRCCVHLRMHIAQSHTAGEQPTTCIVHHPHVSTVQCALSAALRTHTCWAERNERMIETHTQTHRQKAHSSIYRVSVWRMWRTYTWRAACCLYVKRIITPSIEPSNEWWAFACRVSHFLESHDTIYTTLYYNIYYSSAGRPLSYA